MYVYTKSSSNASRSLSFHAVIKIMMVPVEFSTNEAVSLEKQVDNSTKAIHTNLEDIDDVYDIDKCAKWITKNDFKKVCLQFPDFLLPDSSEIAQRLQSLLHQTVYVMGDTAYESCCIDYVAAAHVNADAIIHFGPVCFSRPSGKIPCLTIYERKPLDIRRMKEAFLAQFSLFKEDVIMLIDAPYILHLDSIREIFKGYPGLTICPIDKEHLNLHSLIAIFIGENRRKIVNLKLSFKPKELYFFDSKIEPAKFINYEQDSKMLRRRYFLVEKIKDSKTVGIVIGTLAVRNYLRVIERIKKLVRVSCKKYYVISVGKPTVAKLANFLELDVYVVISCAMNEIYESHDFYKPIVTPFDIELALNPEANDLQFSYDYNSYLPDKDLSESDLENIKKLDNSENDVSLITGKVRTCTVQEEETQSTEGTQIALKTEGTVAVNTSFGAGFLSERSWKGLEQALGEKEPEIATEGRRGIAQGYQNEKL